MSAQHTPERLYQIVDVMKLDRAGNYYCKHLNAMTGEGLHNKSDIAAQLGHRDYVIAQLEQQRDDLQFSLDKEVKRVMELQAKYDELLYAVASKHPNESRHETALRYIKDREMAKAIAGLGGQAQGVV